MISYTQVSVHASAYLHAHMDAGRAWVYFAVGLEGLHPTFELLLLVLHPLDRVAQIFDLVIVPEKMKQNFCTDLHLAACHLRLNDKVRLPFNDCWPNSKWHGV